MDTKKKESDKKTCTTRKKRKYECGTKQPTKQEQLKINKWRKWSLTPHSPDEIRAEILKDSDCVCVTYLCEFSVIPSSFLEEFMVLSTFLLDESNYKTDYEKVKNLLFTKLEIDDYDENLREITIHNKKGSQTVTLDDINDRIDWKLIGKMQKIDLYTAERFGKFLPWDLMTPKCGLSQEYIDANKYEYINKFNKTKQIRGYNHRKAQIDNVELDFDTEDFDEDIEVDFSDDLNAELMGLDI